MSWGFFWFFCCCFFGVFLCQLSRGFSGKACEGTGVMGISYASQWFGLDESRHLSKLIEIYLRSLHFICVTWKINWNKKYPHISLFWNTVFLFFVCLFIISG